MKILQKKMTYDEVIEYIRTHPKYSLLDSNVNSKVSPFYGKLYPEGKYRFTNSFWTKSFSRLMKYPVYLEYSKEYKEELAEMLKHKDSTVVEFVKKYC